MPGICPVKARHIFLIESCSESGDFFSFVICFLCEGRDILFLFFGGLSYSCKNNQGWTTYLLLHQTVMWDISICMLEIQIFSFLYITVRLLASGPHLFSRTFLSWWQLFSLCLVGMSCLSIFSCNNCFQGRKQKRGIALLIFFKSNTPQHNHLWKYISAFIKFCHGFFFFED